MNRKKSPQNIPIFHVGWSLLDFLLKIKANQNWAAVILSDKEK